MTEVENLKIDISKDIYEIIIEITEGKIVNSQAVVIRLCKILDKLE